MCDSTVQVNDASHPDLCVKTFWVPQHKHAMAVGWATQHKNARTTCWATHIPMTDASAFFGDPAKTCQVN